ncbi:MAG: antibiotic biosynthesis monooxygenase [Verrucomicrobiales bacterium]|nr:antibiotic biosynthesis monooxygenase [Verrucomicrobiales bacterium]
MSSVPVTVTARLKAQPGKQTALRELLAALVVPTRREDGCLNYDLHVASDDPSVLLFHENWRSKADLDRHLGSPHVTAVLAQLPALLAEPPEMTLWSKIA